MAFCRHALASGNFRVRALCRNPESVRAKSLADHGAEICIADNCDLDSLKAAFEGAHGVYAITTWSGSSFADDGSLVRANDLDPGRLEESEVAQGLNILRAAEGTPSLTHFVLQSMHRGGRQPIDASVAAPLHHRAKWRLEGALRASSLRCAWSILRQPTYLENFANDAVAAKGTELRQLTGGVVSGLLAQDEELTVISVDDLGAMALAVLHRGPEAYAGRVLAVGAERITGRRLAAAASKVHGRLQFEYMQVPWWVLEFLIPVSYPKQLKRWLSDGGNDEGARDDAEETVFAMSRELYPGVRTVEEWFVLQGVRELSASSGPQHLTARRRVLGGALAAAVPALTVIVGQWLPPAARPLGLPASALLAERQPM